MKKILLLTLSVVLTVGVSAQKRSGYEGSVEIGMGLSTQHSYGDYSVNTVHGYRFNPYVFLGGGVGGVVTNFTEREHILTVLGSKEVEPTTIFTPSMFVRGKFNFLKTSVSPFGAVDLGYNASMTGSDTINMGGVFMMPAVGVDFNLGTARKYAIYLKLGYCIQKNENLLSWGGEITSFQKVNFNVGFRF